MVFLLFNMFSLKGSLEKDKGTIVDIRTHLWQYASNRIPAETVFQHLKVVHLEDKMNVKRCGGNIVSNRTHPGKYIDGEPNLAVEQGSGFTGLGCEGCKYWPPCSKLRVD
jgi:hypothetical protein